MPRMSLLFVWVVGTALVLLSFGSVAGEPDSSDRSRDRDLVGKCRRQSDDALTPAAVKEALRTLCETLRIQYVRKHGSEP
jgi:hypothetical protein